MSFAGSKMGKWCVIHTKILYIINFVSVYYSYRKFTLYEQIYEKKIWNDGFIYFEGPPGLYTSSDITVTALGAPSRGTSMRYFPYVDSPITLLLDIFTLNFLLHHTSPKTVTSFYSLSAESATETASSA